MKHHFFIPKFLSSTIFSGMPHLDAHFALCISEGKFTLYFWRKSHFIFLKKKSLCISEGFKFEGYQFPPFRIDCKSNSGGLLTYVKLMTFLCVSCQSRRHGFQIFLVIFCLLEHKNRLFIAYFIRVFVWENPIPRKFIPAKWINLADSRN